MAGFAKLAKVIDLDPLNSVIDLAWGEREMRLSVIEAERRMVWEQDAGRWCREEVCQVL